MIITIDGLTGSGKSTIARKLAIRLGFIHLNSGALFRSVALKAKEECLSLEDDGQISELAKRTKFSFFLLDNKETSLLVDGADLGGKLKEENVGAFASKVALLPSLREELVKVQREVAENFSVVLEGRDSGTVVFPEADLKFYLFASLEIRAKRRALELGIVPDGIVSALSTKEAKVVDAGANKEMNEKFLFLKNQIESRDIQDSTREFAPHRKADDAAVIDTSDRGVQEVVDELFNRVMSLGK